MIRGLPVAVFCFLSPVFAYAETVIDFRAFVQSSYTHRESLPGATTTASAIRRSLGQTPGFRLEARILQDKSPEDLKAFLQSLPDEKEAALSVVYIAGHQSAGGEFEFTGKQKILWSGLLDGVAVPAHSHRITILDACYAEAAALRSEMVEKLGPAVIFSSSAAERTYELELRTRRPVDYAARYPGEMKWLNSGPDTKPARQITFLGLMWSQAFLQKAPSPSLEDWENFCLRMQRAAEEFRKERSDKLASTIVIRGQL